MMHCKHFEGQQVSIYTKLHFLCPFSFCLYPIIYTMPGSLGTGLFPVISMSESDPQKWECILLSTCLITWGMYQRIADRCRINSYFMYRTPFTWAPSDWLVSVSSRWITLSERARQWLFQTKSIRLMLAKTTSDFQLLCTNHAWLWALKHAE